MNLFTAIYRFNKFYVTRLQEICSEKGITPVQWLVLQHIYKNEGCTSIDIVKEWSVEKPTVSSLVRKLYEQGLLDYREGEDKRHKRLYLTEEGYKTIAMSDWVKNKKANNDLLVKITIPVHPSTDAHTFYKKVGRRETFTAAIVTVCGQIIRTETQAIDSLTLAIGGGSNKPLRLIKTEHYITNKTVELIDWHFVYQCILEEYNPVTDAFVTSNYKKKVAANLIISELQSLLKTHIEKEVHVYEM